MSISIKTSKDLDGLRAANKIVAQTLDYTAEILRPGMSLLQIDKMIENFIISKGAKPSCKGLYGFPNASCLSLNETIIHGIPDETILKDGDILGVDLVVGLNGYYGDSARTLPVGEISQSDANLIACSKDALEFVANFIKVGMHFKEVSYALEQFILERGYVPLVGFCGHGIGKRPHEEPEIPNYCESKNPKQGPKIRNGMVFCIEPMICQKDGTPVIAKNHWNVTSKDGLRTSHYEHCFAMVDNKVEILSKS